MEEQAGALGLVKVESLLPRIWPSWSHKEDADLLRSICTVASELGVKIVALFCAVVRAVEYIFRHTTCLHTLALLWVLC